MESANGLDCVKLELLRAKILIGAGLLDAAEVALVHAENEIRTGKETNRLMELLVLKSDLNLCKGRPYRILDLMSEVFSTPDSETLDPERGLFFMYRGLAFLMLGKVRDAHQDFDEYVRAVERSKDESAETHGRFFHALAFERHMEPCMASAELEIAKEIAREQKCTIRVRLNAFIAHLWLCRGAQEISRAMMEEALKWLDEGLEQEEPVDLGMIYLVLAELLAYSSDWQESEELFERSVQMFRLDRLWSFYETLAFAWYGQTLIAVGRSEVGNRFLANVGAFS